MFYWTNGWPHILDKVLREKSQIEMNSETYVENLVDIKQFKNRMSKFKNPFVKILAGSCVACFTLWT